MIDSVAAFNVLVRTEGSRKWTLPDQLEIGTQLSSRKRDNIGFRNVKSSRQRRTCDGGIGRCFTELI